MTDNKDIITRILEENNRRKEANNHRFDPITGHGSVGRRIRFSLPDSPFGELMLPESMISTPFMQSLTAAGSVRQFIRNEGGNADNEESVEAFEEAFVRLRCRHDFPFWAASFVKIQSKEPGEGEIPFILTRPQRKFVEKLEEKRLAAKPIRLILLKARQWGGSTTSQLYMAWLQLIHRVGLNSVIVSQTKKTSYAIKDMFDRALKSYPVAMLHDMGDTFNENEPKMVNVGSSGDYKRIPQRDCKITIASYESPDAIRGDSYSLVHCSEVGLWIPTDTKSPHSVVKSACSGVLLRPYTMIIFESTANGTGNFFQSEYDAAKAGRSLFDSLFISWYDIDLYSTPLDDSEIREFAAGLYSSRLSTHVSSSREEPGRYLWWLWEQGATLEAIKWYITERAGKESHAVMASEYPTDDDEAFQNSGTMVFDRQLVAVLKKSCRPPCHVGEICSMSGERKPGGKRLKDLRFVEDPHGSLDVWNLPDSYIEPENEEIINNRYLTVVDIGGRSASADYSVILVIDRLPMVEGEKPVVVAQWYGHTDMDILAWKAAEIAAFYDKALLVIESNTIDSRDPARGLEGGDQSLYIFNQLAEEYPNLYERSSSSDNLFESAPRKYGFHTNVHTKPMIISGLQKYIRENAYIERDERCISEYLFYEKRPNGSFGAVKGKHDDLLMTRAIGLHVCFNEMDIPTITMRESHKIARKGISEATL